jgi:FixJ family two-component response regulator
VLDLQMAGPGGLELQEALAQAEEPLPVVFLTAHGDISSSVQAMKRGAVDFLTKPVRGDELLDAVQRALARGAAARETQRQKREWGARYESLTPREREVFALVVRGLLNKQISDVLGASERTVKAHRCVSDRAAACASSRARMRRPKWAACLPISSNVTIQPPTIPCPT